MENQGFNIPVVLFMFKREKAVEIIRRISCVKPRKLYLLGDQGRTDEEKDLVYKCREKVERAINWECKVIKNYAEENRGVYRNIAEGAKWVFEHEESAIFLEDDNLPEITFFHFCKELLEKYKYDTRILWICGTNYLGKYKPDDAVSYVYTKHMLPCGWASWANKFLEFYDGELELCENPTVMNRISSQYCNRKVYKQYRNSWLSEYKRIHAGKLPQSWDFQMDFSIKANNLFGICPCNNQIKNIGVDILSTHGGTSFENIMTKRFCGMDAFPIEFPLHHPKTVLPDPKFEKLIGNIILYPFRMRMRIRIAKLLHNFLKIPDGVRLFQYVKGKISK